MVNFSLVINSEKIVPIVQDLLEVILEEYDNRVSVLGPFQDLRVGKQIDFSFSDTELRNPGKLEFAVLNMDSGIDPLYDNKRFLSIRVKKTSRGGFVSTTLFHGTRDELKDSLLDEANQPVIVMQKLEELLSGLPEETNPDIWR